MAMMNTMISNTESKIESLQQDLRRTVNIGNEAKGNTSRRIQANLNGRNNMTVAIIGAGAVGLYVGARLAEAGEVDVCFLMRSDYEMAMQRGVKAESPQGNVQVKNPWAVRSATEIGKVDWVICALKTTAVSTKTLQELIAPCVDSNTRIHLLMNGLGMEEAFAEQFPPENIFGGLVFGGLTRLAPAHVKHEGVPFEIRGGHYLDKKEGLQAAINLWRNVPGVIYNPQPCLLRAQWTKLCWNFTFNGLTVLGGGCGVNRIMDNEALETTSRALIRELVSVANADLLAHGKEDAATINPIDTEEMLITITKTMKTYKPSTTVDFLKRERMEINSIFLEPLKRSMNLNVSAPILTVVAGLLDVIDQQFV